MATFVSPTTGEPLGVAETYARLARRRAAVVVCLAVACLISLAADLAIGPSGMSLGTLRSGLLDPDTLSAGERVILLEVRLPAALIALAVGACLGLAGAEMQTVLNNPLASPYTLGLSWAAMLGAVVAIVLGLDGLGLGPSVTLPLSAFAGAVAAGLGVQAFARAFGARTETMVLFGIALVFLCSALIALLQFVADAATVQRTVLWHMGSLARATLGQAAIVFAAFAVAVPFAFASAWSMTLLRGGEEQAESLGLSAGRLRRAALLRASFLTAAAVAFVGPVGFIGLVGPHIARLLVGEDHRVFLPAAAITGALLLSLGAIVSKTVVPGVLVPVGIVTSLLGLPVFLALVVAQRRGG